MAHAFERIGHVMFKRFFSGLSVIWWVKSASVLLAVLFGLMFTLPSFLGDPAQWPRLQEGINKGKPSQFMHRMAEAILPSSRISLGLDLKGGLHLLFEVEVEKSVQDFISRSFIRVKESAQTKGIKTSDYVVKEDFSVSFVVDDASKKEDLTKIVSEQSAYVIFDKLEGNKMFFVANSAAISKFQIQILEQAMSTIRNRIDQFGVAEPSIFKQGDKRIVVQMPGMQDAARAKQLIGNTAKLDFRMVLNEVPQEQLEVLLKEARTALNIPELENSPQEIQKLSQWLREKNKISANSTIVLQRVTQTEAGVSKVTNTIPYLVDAQAKLTGEMIETAEALQSQGNFLPEPVVSLKFNPQGTKLFGDLTTAAYQPANTPHQVAIILDDNVTSAPVVNGPILGGDAQITMGRGGVDQNSRMKEAQDLALVLRAGALPASVKVIEERQVGPSEGESNIRKGVMSSLIAASIVIVFMVFVYGTSGFVANIAMLINVLLILAFLAAFGATLTLPGIAGIVLTMAVAVDGNVIINERIREEVQNGLSSKAAFYKGYNHSFGTLVDAHVTSAVAGFVLLVYGNPAVKGFAITLLAGIVATLFTSYYVTEVIGEWLIEKTKIKRFM
jgi:preprotein translocase subunit SecD